MADIISEEATKPFEDVPNKVIVNSEQLKIQDLPADDIVLEGLLNINDETEIWTFGVGGPA